MLEHVINIMQLIGGVLLSFWYIPQIRKIVRDKSVIGFSCMYIALMFLGIALMEVYAIYNVLNGVAYMFFITNTVSTVLSLMMLILYLKFSDK